MHGSKVMFRGDPPTHPNDFLNRYLLSSHTSSRTMASDFRSTCNFLPRVSKEFGTKRGLQTELPLDAKIREYYGPNPDNDRWLRRHAVFNYLYRQKEATTDTPDDDIEEADQDLKDLQDTFANLATKITPPKPRRKGKNKSRVRKPDFNKQDEIHANLFGTMKSELQDSEVHSNFDFLSFYRRAYDLVLRIREEVLMSDEARRFRAEDMNANPDPPNFQLINDLFRALQIEPKTKKEKEAEAEEGAGQQLSTKVVPLKQIRRVAEMMLDLTRGKGDVELMRAKLRVKGDWEGLKASYAAEEAEKETPVVDDTIVQVEEEAVLAVAEDRAGVEAPLRLDDGDHRVKPKFEADGDSEDSPIYTPGSQLLGQEHAENDLEDILNQTTILEITDTATDVQDNEVPSGQEDRKNDIKRRYEADEDSEKSTAYLPSPGDQIDNSAEDTRSQRILTFVARKVEQSHSLDGQVRQIISTANSTSLAALIHADELYDAAPMARSPSGIKNGTRPKEVYDRITYSSTTSRKHHIITVHPSRTSKETKILALSQPRRGFFRRLTGTASKHHVAFRCYTRCGMARALHGQQTRLQRQMAIAVVELKKKKARRDSAELEKVWLGAGDGDGYMGKVWESESDVSLD
ncbi:uncharacterized protein ALTATR162_LOCUS10859 [Alternaria atra]|nr:uncharacterized protein ALTATR162_LOCUS10859 [Alternaria atra]CAG5183999.1 unnamed protein product [Alternaria atra]